MIRKWLTIGITLIFIGICIIPSTAQNTEKQSSRANWLYVGGSGPGNYTRIQDAINNAVNGNTIFVYSNGSPYCEIIKLHKSIKLIGENRSNTRITGNGEYAYVVGITADNAEISGFTINNSYPGELCGGVAIYANDVLVKNNILYGNGNGVMIKDYGNYIYRANISENMIINNTWTGILFDGTKNCIIFKNEITSNKREGVRTLYSHETKFIGNLIDNNRNAGINFWDSHKMLVEKNNLSSNSHGIFSWTGSSEGIIQNNTMNYNANDGIFIDQSYDKGNFKIRNNSIKYNERFGIKIQFSTKNIVQNNEISENVNGLYILGAERNKIQGNNFTNNIECGILIESGYECSFFNEFSYNNFLGNSVNAHDECRNTWFNIWKTKGNYWDDYTGEDKDGDGVGDTVYDIEGGKNKDKYPLMKPCDNITSYTINNQYVYQGSLVSQLHLASTRVFSKASQEDNLVEVNTHQDFNQLNGNETPRYPKLLAFVVLILWLQLRKGSWFYNHSIVWEREKMYITNPLLLLRGMWLIWKATGWASIWMILATILDWN